METTGNQEFRLTLDSAEVTSEKERDQYLAKGFKLIGERIKMGPRNRELKVWELRKVSSYDDRLDLRIFLMKAAMKNRMRKKRNSSVFGRRRRGKRKGTLI